MKKVLIVTLLAVASCSPKLTESTTKTITEVVRDTTFVVKADSSYYRAWIECRDNTPLLIEKDTIFKHDTAFVAIKGDYLEVPKVGLKDNILEVEAKANPHEVKAKITDKNTVEEKTIIKEVEKKLSWWQKLFIWTGVAYWLVLIVIIGIRLSPLGKKLNFLNILK